jgi:hypothetical protein
VRRALIVAVAAAVLVLPACGGGGGGSGIPSGPPLTKAEYQKKLLQIAQSVSSGLKDSTGKKTISKADVDQFVAVFRAFADRLKDVNPPAEIKDLHQRLIAAMTDFGDEFPDIADKLNKAQNLKDPSEAIAALFGAKAVQELIKLETEFKAKGYDLNLNGQTTTPEHD